MRLTQDALAKRAKTPKTTIARIEADAEGVQRPGSRNVMPARLAMPAMRSADSQAIG